MLMHVCHITYGHLYSYMDLHDVNVVYGLSLYVCVCLGRVSMVELRTPLREAGAATGPDATTSILLCLCCMRLMFMSDN